MSLYTELCANVLFPLHEKLKKHDTVAIKNSLEVSQWNTRDEILTERDTRLKKFIEHCATHVPFYRDLFAQLGIDKSDIQGASDLRKLPLLDKAIISENFEKLKSDKQGHVSRFTTGGSSGTPLVFLLGKERVSHDVAEKWRATRWWNVDIGDREIVAWGSPIELTKQDRIKAIRDKLLRTKLIPAFDLSEQNKIQFLHDIKVFKPKMLFGYPSVYHLLAQTALDNNIDMGSLGIKVVFVTSERLYPYQRELIERVFNAPVANGYGGRDAGFIAHECPAGNMHISAEEIIVETIREDGSACEFGESGEIVVTHMATSDFPFIRYRTGDIGKLSDKTCPCGRGLPILEEIEGRSTDFVVASDGTMMHGLSLIYILREYESIDAFKIVQETKLQTTIYIVKKDNYPESADEAIKQGFRARLGNDVNIKINYVCNIEAEKSGKYRYVISKVV